MKAESLTLEKLSKSQRGRELLEAIEREERGEQEWARAAQELRELRAAWPGRLAEIMARKQAARDAVESARAGLSNARRELSELFNAEIAGIEAFNRREGQLKDILFTNAPESLRAELSTLRDALSASFDEQPDYPTSTDLARRKVYVDLTKKEALIRKREDLRAAIEAAERRIEGAEA